jgi:predicted nucleic acid binding AN1-type Zn finger protein
MQDMPFKCNYCKEPFCAEHRLPEELDVLNYLSSELRDLEKEE